MHFLAQNVAQNLPENAKNHTVPAALGQLAACAASCQVLAPLPHLNGTCAKFSAMLEEQALVKLSAAQDPLQFEVAEPQGSPSGTERQQLKYYKAL